MPMQIVVTLVIALAAAVRGNWSPCGESLQAQIHPIGESSRGNRWLLTISAFTFGSVLAGGATTLGFAAVGSLLPITPSTALLLTAVVGVLAGSLDLSPFKPWTPRRQVNENWIGRYRGWVYGFAFGVQLGVGFTVFVMSWGYYAMLFGAFLSGSIWWGAGIGAVFGLGRGILLFLAGWIRTPQQLKQFHGRMQQIRPLVFSSTGMAIVLVSVLGLL